MARFLMMTALGISAVCGVPGICDDGGDRAQPPAASMSFPEKQWEVVAPARQGIDAELLGQAIDALKNDISRLKGRNLDNAVLIRRGQIVWQTPAAEQQKVEHIWSATKSVASSVLGAMIDRKLCTLDTKAADYLPELREHYSEVNLRHLFTMTSAIRIEPKTALGSLPSYGKPGTVFGYSNENIGIGGRVLEKIAGRTLDELFKEYLGDPIGMGINKWSPRIPGYGIHTSAHDLGRIGHLFLNRGRWKDRQVLSEEWVGLATRVQVEPQIPRVYGGPDFKGSGCYGIAWWLNGMMPSGERPYPNAPQRLWQAWGWQGNHLFVIPDWGIVFVVLQTKLDTAENHRVFNAFFHRLRSALTDLDRPPAPAGKHSQP